MKEVSLQDKPDKQNFNENQKKFESLTDTIKNTSEDLTKTNTEISNKNNKALGTALELMIDKGVIAPILAASLVNRFKLENKDLNKLLKDQISGRINDFLIKISIPVTLYSNMLTFRDTKRFFKLDRYLSKNITKYSFNISRFIPQDQKLFFEFGKEMK